MMLRHLLRRLFREEQGQDLTEYTLLITLVSLVAIGLMYSTGRTTAHVWSSADNTLQSATIAASSDPALPPGGGSGGSGGTGGGNEDSGDHDSR